MALSKRQVLLFLAVSSLAVLVLSQEAVPAADASTAAAEPEKHKKDDYGYKKDDYGYDVSRCCLFLLLRCSKQRRKIALEATGHGGGPKGC